MSGSINKISSQQVISSARQQLGINHAGENLYFLKLIGDACRRIGSDKYIIDREATLQIQNGMASLPWGFYSLNNLMFRDGGQNAGRRGHCVSSDFYTFANSPESRSDVQNNFNPYYYQIQGDNLVFSSDLDYDTCYISYKGYNLDTDGFPNIPADYEMPLSFYLCCWWCLKHRDYKGAQAYQMEWAKTALSVRVDHAMSGQAELAYDALIWNSKLPCYRLRT